MRTEQALEGMKAFPPLPRPHVLWNRWTHQRPGPLDTDDALVAGLLRLGCIICHDIRRPDAGALTRLARLAADQPGASLALRWSLDAALKFDVAAHGGVNVTNPASYPKPYSVADPNYAALPAALRARLDAAMEAIKAAGSDRHSVRYVAIDHEYLRFDDPALIPPSDWLDIGRMFDRIETAILARFPAAEVVWYDAPSWRHGQGYVPTARPLGHVCPSLYRPWDREKTRRDLWGRCLLSWGAAVTGPAGRWLHMARGAKLAPFVSLAAGYDANDKWQWRLNYPPARSRELAELLATCVREPARLYALDSVWVYPGPCALVDERSWWAHWMAWCEGWQQAAPAST